MILINYSILFSLGVFAFKGLDNQINREQFNRTVEMEVTTSEPDAKKIIWDIDQIDSVEKSYFIKKTDKNVFEIHVVLKDFSQRKQMILDVPKYFDIVDVTLHKIEGMMVTISKIKKAILFVFLFALLVQPIWYTYMIKKFFNEFSYEIKLLSTLGYSQKQIGCILGLPFLWDGLIGIFIAYGVQKILVDVILDRLFRQMFFMRALEIHYSHSFVGDLFGFSLLGVFFVTFSLVNLRKLISSY